MNRSIKIIIRGKKKKDFRPPDRPFLEGTREIGNNFFFNLRVA